MLQFIPQGAIKEDFIFMPILKTKSQQCFYFTEFKSCTNADLKNSLPRSFIAGCPVDLHYIPFTYLQQLSFLNPYLLKMFYLVLFNRIPITLIKVCYISITGINFPRMSYSFRNIISITFSKTMFFITHYQIYLSF